MPFKKSIFVVMTLLIGAGIAAGLFFMKERADENEEPEHLRQVLTYPIELQDLPRTIQGQGLVNSAETLTLHSQVTGEVIYSFQGMKEGVSFTKDTPLLFLDSASVESQLQISETALLKSLTSMISSLSSQSNDTILSKWKSFRTRILQNGPMPPLPEGNSEWERLYISQFGIPDRYYQWKELSRQRALHDFYAPFDGQIHSMGHPEGSLIFQGQEIATLINPKLLETSLALSAEESRYLEESSQVHVRIFDNSDYQNGMEAAILRVSGLLDSRTQTRTLYIGYDNSNALLNLLPGSYAYIEITGDPPGNY